MTKRIGIVVYPGSNCDVDCYRACKHLGFDVDYIDHREADLSKFDIVILPGGFSYGDYMGAGKLATLSPATQALKHFKGIKVGICNGFQVLCQMGMIKGILTTNENNKFICKTTEIDFLGKRLTIPIAHKEGRFLIAKNDLKDYELIKYVDNPNGSDFDIAGIIDRKNKILAMMPHPERAVFKELGSTDGVEIFRNLIDNFMA